MLAIVIRSKRKSRRKAAASRYDDGTGPYARSGFRRSVWNTQLSAGPTSIYHSPFGVHRDATHAITSPLNLGRSNTHATTASGATSRSFPASTITGSRSSHSQTYDSQPQWPSPAPSYSSPAPSYRSPNLHSYENSHLGGGGHARSASVQLFAPGGDYKHDGHTAGRGGLSLGLGPGDPAAVALPFTPQPIPAAYQLGVVDHADGAVRGSRVNRVRMSLLRNQTGVHTFAAMTGSGRRASYREPWEQLVTDEAGTADKAAGISALGQGVQEPRPGQGQGQGQGQWQQQQQQQQVPRSPAGWHGQHSRSPSVGRSPPIGPGSRSASIGLSGRNIGPTASPATGMLPSPGPIPPPGPFPPPSETPRNGNARKRMTLVEAAEQDIDFIDMVVKMEATGAGAGRHNHGYERYPGNFIVGGGDNVQDLQRDLEFVDLVRHMEDVRREGGGPGQGYDRYQGNSFGARGGEDANFFRLLQNQR